MDEASRLRRKDTTKGPPLRVLSLDGGGVRGYSMLIILQELMHRTFVEIEGRAPKRDEIPKPCDHFDLIAGTGTGGLIALMLGRLRLDLDTCKDLYVRMTRRVFETDKTFAGIPFKSTMYKASKLEEVIREVVREHTVSSSEGNDRLANATPMSPDVEDSATNAGPQRTMSQSSRYSQVGMSPTSQRLSFGPLALGNPNALLYDTREDRTKTAVTAMLRGTSATTLLRSYDSRKQPAPETNCTIWQAGRATSAIALAFKPIQIGQSHYLDDGSGKYNPSPLVLDEATVNEWPGREIGVFVSIGTGKRPPGTGQNQQEWWEGFLGGTVGEFAEARRRLIAKLEACEDTHAYMLREHLPARGVRADNYYRLNVEVGVGEFGMNEWARLSDVSNNTRLYLAKAEVEALNQSAAVKLARVHQARVRHEREELKGGVASGEQYRREHWPNSWDQPLPTVPPPANPTAVELPGDDSYLQTQGFRPGARHYEHRPSIADMKYAIAPNDQHRPQQWDAGHPGAPNRAAQPPYPTPHHSSESSPFTPSSAQSRHSHEDARRHDDAAHQYAHPRPAHSPPPLPPKTPIGAPSGGLPSFSQPGSPAQNFPAANAGPRTFINMGDLSRRLPYPDVEGPPPTVNPATKPQIPR